MKRVFAGLGIFVLACAGLFLLVNVNSLDDGIRYLQAAANDSPLSAQPLDVRGKFGFCESFMALRNAQRAQFIANYLDARGIAYQRLPIGESGFDNIWVPFAAQGNGAAGNGAAGNGAAGNGAAGNGAAGNGAAGNGAAGNGAASVPYTIFSAHYDKFFDDPEYQGASDNSAAVCMLLVAAGELQNQKPERPVAILFTGEEEIGLVGAKAFYEYATRNKVDVAEVLNFDSLGRGGLAARASGEISGFVFTIPLVGDFVYDGRQLTNASAYRQPDAAVVQRLQRAAPLTVYDRMVAKSDGTYFQDNGWNAVNITSDDIHYLEQTWHTYGDRIELLQEENLNRALALVLNYARQEQ